MSIDEQIESAGSRLARTPVAVPELATTATSGLVVVIDTALPNTGQRFVITAVKGANTTTTAVTTT